MTTEKDEIKALKAKVDDLNSKMKSQPKQRTPQEIEKATDIFQAELYKYFDTKNWITVKSNAGSLLINDPTTTYKNPNTGKVEWFYVAFTEAEAKKGLSKLVPNNAYFANYLKNDTLVQVQGKKVHIEPDKQEAIE